jgi:hypothetical protein
VHCCWPPAFAVDAAAAPRLMQMRRHWAELCCPVGRPADCSTAIGHSSPTEGSRSHPDRNCVVQRPSIEPAGRWTGRAGHFHGDSRGGLEELQSSRKMLEGRGSGWGNDGTDVGLGAAIVVARSLREHAMVVGGAHGGCALQKWLIS